MLKAIRYSALDYILKPVGIPELVAAVARAGERLTSISANRQLELLLANIGQPSRVQRIAIPHKDEYLFVPINEIERLEAKGAYTEIWLQWESLTSCLRT